MPPPAHMRPKPQRRDQHGAGYGSLDPSPALPVGPVIEAFIRHHQTDWSPSTLRNARHYLLLGRFPDFCREAGIASIGQLTTDQVERFLSDVSTVLQPGTVTKYRTYLRALARFQAERPGYGAGLANVERIPKPREPKFKLPAALSREQESAVVSASVTTRDRLIVEVLLATGLRVSELCALTTDGLHLDSRPPYLLVSGSAHDRGQTKSGRDRKVPFRSSYSSLPRRLAEYAANERGRAGPSMRGEVFLSEYRDGSGRPRPLTVWGVQQLMQRIAARTGIPVHAHKLRHTWATRCVDAGIPIFHLQQAGGWSSLEMVRRYYTAHDREMLSSFARAIDA